jgi:hypothetical protein
VVVRAALQVLPTERSELLKKPHDAQTLTDVRFGEGWFRFAESSLQRSQISEAILDAILDTVGGGPRIGRYPDAAT